MYYFVTVATTVGRQLNHIRAKDRNAARQIVADCNRRYPKGRMRLLKRRATNQQAKLETRLFSRKR